MKGSLFRDRMGQISPGKIDYSPLSPIFDPFVALNGHFTSKIAVLAIRCIFFRKLIYFPANFREMQGLDKLFKTVLGYFRAILASNGHLRPVMAVLHISCHQVYLICK